MGVSCKNCGGTELDNDPARGDSVCTGCGSVVQSLCIVNEVEFQENSAGSASVIGQFVSGESNHVSLGSNFKYGIGRDHRQIILDNGRQLIHTMGGLLKMSSHCLDSAFMFYKMAVSKRFTTGRKTVYVIGACLYLVSRTEKTPHMLLDVCDVVQCDVVTLGRVFLQLARELCIDCPIVDPSLYIHRFAHQLDFGDKENEVSMAALRIMARMKKDWIHFGRRPSALCGAALIIGAKLFNFTVTMDDIVKLVRMSKTTVFKRLMDFGKTATGKLTTEEFKTVDLEEEADPPCYTEGRNRVKFAQELGDECKFVSSDVLSQVVKTQEKLENLLDKRKSIHSEIETSTNEAKSFDYRSELPQNCSFYSYELDENGDLKVAPYVIHKQDVDDEDDENEETNVDPNNHNQRIAGTTASSTLLMDNSIKKQDEDAENSEEEVIEDIEVDLTGIDDDEIDKLLLTEHEIKIKTEIWLDENRDYLQKMKEKEEERKRKEEEDNKNGVKKRKRNLKRKNKDKPICDTADEAIKTMLAERKLSSKINYDVLRGLKTEDTGGNNNNKNDFNVIKEESNDEIKLVKIEDTKLNPIVYESGPVNNKSILSKKRAVVFPTFLDHASKARTLSDSSLTTKTSIPSGGSKVTVNETGGNINYDDEEEIVEEEEEEENTIRASSLFAKEIDEFDTYDGYDEVDAFY